VIVHPPRGDHGRLSGRRFVTMTPTPTLDQIMTPTDVAWHTRITPARQDDLLAMKSAVPRAPRGVTPT
jgi:hypothetical protein